MSNQIQIRNANLSDLVEIHECNKRNLPLYYNTVELLFMHISSYHLIIVAEFNKKIVGYVICEYQGSVCQIISLGVDFNYRRLGVATNLLQSLEAQVRQHCKTLSLYVKTDNSSAILFYTKYKFKKIQLIKDYYKGATFDKDSNSVDAYLMQRHLD